MSSMNRDTDGQSVREHTKMKILILGINHQIQAADILGFSSDGEMEKLERQQKEQFTLLLQQMITKNGVQIVGEETKHGVESIAKRVCDSEERRHTNIEMTPDERKEREIPPLYNENPETLPADRERWNREREEFMIKRTIADAAGMENVMVICGRMHMQPLATRFSELGHTVETADVQDQSWYIEDWLEHILYR